MKKVAQQTILQCSICETKFPIFRKVSKLKQKGHEKHLWCYKCKEVTKHIELGSY